MNSFYEHHRDSIRFHYRCFDRILAQRIDPAVSTAGEGHRFFRRLPTLVPGESGHVAWHCRSLSAVAEAVVGEAQRSGPGGAKGRHDEFVESYFKRAKPDEVVAVLKAREPARIMIAIGDRAANRWHLQFAERWVVQFNFYVNDERWGRMFVRMCPYLPFSARVCLNQHHWLANRMREEGIDFQQCSNAFMRCAKPERLQELADELSPRDLVICGQKGLACFTPFFTAAEREDAGCHHRLFFAQTEFCDNRVRSKVMRSGGAA